MMRELRWVSCEACGGSGEVEVAPMVGPYADPTPHGELCSACDGTGRDHFVIVTVRLAATQKRCLTIFAIADALNLQFRITNK